MGGPARTLQPAWPLT